MRCGKFSYAWVVPVLLAISTSTVPANDYYPSPGSQGGWRKNVEPEFIRSRGLDPLNVKAFGEYNLSIPNQSHIEGHDYHEHTGALVIKDGWIVGEWYRRPDGATYMNYLSSIGKSLALACFGIAELDGVRGATDTVIGRNSRVYDRRWLETGFPLSDERKQEITFEQVFRHTSGICPQITAQGKILEKGRDRWTDYDAWVVGHDPKWPQTAKLYFDPGQVQDFDGRERWGGHEGAYSSVAFAHVGLVIRGLYGVPAHQFLWERLLQPLGFSGIDYHKPPQPPDIMWFTAGGVRMTTRDLGRFAYLLLRGGRWEDHRLLPEGWVESFTSSPDYQNLRSNVDGYFGRAYPPDMFRLFGSGGNFVFIVPGLDLIAIRTGRTANALTKILQRDFLRRVFLMIPGYEVE